MRIACIYLPSFSLQAHVRQAPHLAGTSLAIADGSVTGSKVTACSRAAWADGIRPGMTAAAARAIAPELEIVHGAPELYRRALDAVVDSLLLHSDIVDAGPEPDAQIHNRAIYIKVPPRQRGATFGQKVLTQLSRQGFRARVGVADDRFTAYVAAVRVEHRGKTSRLDDPGHLPLFHQSCTVVPRAGSAAFLAPLPLTFLPIDPDVQHLLNTCGVKTLGDFAALPPPSMSRDRIDDDNDFQALARGGGTAALRPIDAGEFLARSIVERIELAHHVGDCQPLSFVLRTLCDRAAQRLDGRDRAADTIQLELLGPAGELKAFAIQLDRSTASSRAIADAIRTKLASVKLTHGIAAIELAIIGMVEPAEQDFDLFAARQPAQAAGGSRGRPHISPPRPGGKRPVIVHGDALHATPPVPHQPTRPSKRRRPARARQQVLSFFDQ